jgi:hypothetical protein
MYGDLGQGLCSRTLLSCRVKILDAFLGGYTLSPVVPAMDGGLTLHSSQHQKSRGFQSDRLHNGSLATFR